MDPNDIDTRLAALEARAPGRDDPPELPRSRRRGRFATPMALAGILALVVVASAAAGGIVATLAQGTPGVQNPGQPLEGAKLECMSPPQAAAYLTDHGFTNVVWQVESGVAGEKTGASVQQSNPPDHGYVVPGSVLSDGMLYMIVDQRAGTTGSGACPDLTMP